MIESTQAAADRAAVAAAAGGLETMPLLAHPPKLIAKMITPSARRLAANSRGVPEGIRTAFTT